MEYLRSQTSPLNRERIATALNISDEEQLEALRRRLRAMERDGQLVFTRGQCYGLPERMDLIQGTVLGHRDGYGFFRPDEGGDDLFINMVTCSDTSMATRCWRRRLESIARGAAKLA